jgi:hypothetical protein
MASCRAPRQALSPAVFDFRCATLYLKLLDGERIGRTIGKTIARGLLRRGRGRPAIKSVRSPIEPNAACL